MFYIEQVGKGRSNGLTSNSMGWFTWGPHVKMSFWNVQMPLLDVKEKVFPADSISMRALYR